MPNVIYIKPVSIYPIARAALMQSYYISPGPDPRSSSGMPVVARGSPSKSRFKVVEMTRGKVGSRQFARRSIS